MFLKGRGQEYFGKLSIVKAKTAPAFCQSSASIAASDQHHLCLSRSPQISKKLCGKNWPFFCLQPVGGKGIFLQVKKLGFFPKVQGNAKIYHPMHLCVFYFFHCQCPGIPLFIWIYALFPK